MPRRLREKTETQEEESEQKEEIPTPQNEAEKTTASDVVAVLDENNNPLLKIWCIQRVLLFVQQNGIVYLDSTATSSQQTINLACIPRLLQLKDVTSSWNETVEFYIYSVPSDVVVRFCEYLQEFVTKKHSKSQKHATLARFTCYFRIAIYRR